MNITFYHARTPIISFNDHIIKARNAIKRHYCAIYRRNRTFQTFQNIISKCAVNLLENTSNLTKFRSPSPIHSQNYHIIALYMHSHSAKTHQRALRSARTRPLQMPSSPHLITVSHIPPSLSPLLPSSRSSFRIRRKIFPPGD